MLLLKCLLGFVLLACATSAADSVKFPKSIKLSYEVIGSNDSPKPLAEVLYDPATLKYQLSSWTPPSTDNIKSTSPEPTSSRLVRVLLPDGSSTVTSVDAFSPAVSQDVNLWLSSGNDGEIFSASVSSISPPPLTEEEQREEQRLKRKAERAKAKGKPLPAPSAKPKAKPKGKKGQEDIILDKSPRVQVNLLRATDGPSPRLLSRKPPQVDADGREVAQDEQPEKTFFQKYWWVFLVGTLLLMGGGGSGGEK